MSSYAQHFGLNRPLFENAKGGEYVFVSDQVKLAATVVKRAFGNENPAIAVTGPTGCGKSTATKFALNALGRPVRVISLGRLKLEADEVLDLISKALDIDDLSGGTVRRIGRMAARVRELEKNDTRVVVLVDDVARTGLDVIVELDVLCGGDAGTDIGLVLCGDVSLDAMLSEPQLERLRQRLHGTVRLGTLAVDEMESYLQSAAEQAGGDHNQLFGKDFAGLLHILSCGVPQVARNVVEAALEDAAARGEKRVSCATLADVARSQFGIETELPVHRKTDTAATAPVAAPTPEEAAPAESPAPVAAEKPVEAEPAPEPVPAPEPEPAAPEASPKIATAKPADEKTTDPVIPELIQDTQAELPVLDSDKGSENHDDLPDLTELTAEFAAVSQMLEKLTVDSDDTAFGDDEVSTTKADLAEFDAQPEAANPPETTPADPDIPVIEEATTIAAEDAVEPFVTPEPVIEETAAEEPVAVEPPIVEPPVEEPAAEPAIELSLEATGEVAAPDITPEPVADDIPDIPSLEDSSIASLLKETLDDAVEEANRAVENHAKPDLLDAEQPAWDRDPTLAELRPDLDALELAMSEDTVDEAGIEQATTIVSEDEIQAAAPEAADDEPMEIPEITLDDSIQEKIDKESTPPEPASDEEESAHSDTEIHQMMEQLSEASSIEDMDDKLAETLFGEELSLAASQIIRAREQMEAAENTKPELSLEQTAETAQPDLPVENVSIESPKANAGLDTSASQRLATLRALNANMGKPMPAPAGKSAGTSTPEPKPQPAKPKPVPIEDQIDISMTATFKALKIDPNALEQEAEEPEEKKGFFSRFRKKG